MNDTIKYNRDLLGKKKSVQEIYKDDVTKRGTKYKKETLNNVRERVAIALKRNPASELFDRVVAAVALILLLIAVVWVLYKVDFKTQKKGRYEDKKSLFNTMLHNMPNGTVLKIDYYIHGTKAAQTYLKNGLKHQNSESYYESGEQFRSALYYYDTLVTDIYFYKTGDTIYNFPELSSAKVHRLKLLNKTKDKEIEFDYFDGKVIQATYKEKSITR